MASEEFHQHRTGHVEPLGHLRVHLRVETHLLTSDLLQLVAHAASRNHEHWKDDQSDESETPLECDHRHERGDEHHDVAHHAAESGRDGRLCADHVVVEATDERTGLRPGEECDRHPLNLVEQRDTQVVDETFANPC